MARTKRSDEGQGKEWPEASQTRKGEAKGHDYSIEFKTPSAAKTNLFWQAFSVVWEWICYMYGTPVAYSELPETEKTLKTSTSDRATTEPSKKTTPEHEKASETGTSEAATPATRLSFTATTSPFEEMKERFEALRRVEEAKVEEIVSIDAIQKLESRFDEAVHHGDGDKIVKCLEKVESYYEPLAALIRDPRTSTFKQVAVQNRFERLLKIENRIFGDEYQKLHKELFDGSPNSLRLCLLISEAEERLQFLSMLQIFEDSSRPLISSRIKNLLLMKKEALKTIEDLKESLRLAIDGTIRQEDHRKLEQMAESLGLSRKEGETFGMLARRVYSEIKDRRLERQEEKLRDIIQLAKMHHREKGPFREFINIRMWEMAFAGRGEDLEDLVLKEIEAEVFGF